MPGKLREVSLELREGEILGVFGLMGAGQPELARAIFGLERIHSGRVWIDEREVRLRNPTDAIRHGMGLLTRDRRQGLVPALPVAPNVSLANISQLPLPSPLRAAGREPGGRGVRAQPAHPVPAARSAR